MHEISLKRKTLRPNFKTNFFACAVCILICSPNDILLIRQIFIIALEYCILLKKSWTNSKKTQKGLNKKNIPENTVIQLSLYMYLAYILAQKKCKDVKNGDYSMHWISSCGNNQKVNSTNMKVVLNWYSIHLRWLLTNLSIVPQFFMHKSTDSSAFSWVISHFILQTTERKKNTSRKLLAYMEIVLRHGSLWWLCNIKYIKRVFCVCVWCGWSMCGPFDTERVMSCVKKWKLLHLIAKRFSCAIFMDSLGLW